MKLAAPLLKLVGKFAVVKGRQVGVLLVPGMHNVRRVLRG